MEMGNDGAGIMGSDREWVIRVGKTLILRSLLVFLLVSITHPTGHDMVFGKKRGGEMSQGSFAVSLSRAIS